MVKSSKYQMAIIKTTQMKVSIFFHVLSVSVLNRSVSQPVCLSISYLRAQIFAELIFRIYDLICEIKFHKFKKYPIFSDKTLSFSKYICKKIMTNKKFHRN